MDIEKKNTFVIIKLYQMHNVVLGASLDAQKCSRKQKILEKYIRNCYTSEKGSQKFGSFHLEHNNWII